MFHLQSMPDVLLDTTSLRVFIVLFIVLIHVMMSIGRHSIVLASLLLLYFMPCVSGVCFWLYNI